MNEKKTNNLIGGMILIGIGLLALVGQFVDLQLGEYVGLMILPALGVIFLVWGIIARDFGPLIPGGILSGLGLGIILGEKVSWPEGVDEGGAFLLAFALGWGLITLLSALVTAKTQWWPLIPGGIIGLVGPAVFFGGILWPTLNVMNLGWPVALIILGVSVILNARKAKEKSIEI